MNFEEELKKVMKEGKTAVGVKQTKKNLLRGKAKLVIIAKSAPDEMKDDIRRYASLSNTMVYTYEGSAKDLGYVCAKPFPMSCLAILDENDSKILEVAK